MGVSIFFSLILSYFCFLVPAFRPCHGRLRWKTKEVSKYNLNNSLGETSISVCCQPSAKKVHKHITKRFQIISPTLFCIKNKNTSLYTIIMFEICLNSSQNLTMPLLDAKYTLTNSKMSVDTCIASCSCKILVFPAKGR